jgi:hypothetical protein
MPDKSKGQRECGLDGGGRQDADAGVSGDEIIYPERCQ